MFLEISKFVNKLSLQRKNFRALKSWIPVKSLILLRETFKEVIAAKFDVSTLPLGRPVSIPKEINDEDLLKESGRGLYLIGCYTDEVKFKGNSIIMKKYVNKGAVV